MKHLDWRAFILALTFLSTTAFAVEVFYGQTGSQDWYFNNSVLIDGVELPADLSGTTGTSTVTVEGEGTVTIGNQSIGSSSLNVTISGGTTISVARQWDGEDTKMWWEGTLSAPQSSKDPSPSSISFVTTGKHPNSWVRPLETYIMGMNNESFSFSTPARFTFPTPIPDGTKLWMAMKDDGTPSESDTALWKITEGDFCVTEKNVCSVSLAKLGEVSFVQEYFTQCPRSGDSDTKVENGSIGNPPECRVTCDKGFELDYDTMKCVSTSGATSSASSSPSTPNEVVVSDGGTEGVPPGYFRFTGSREQLRRHITTEGLEGEALTQAERQNASVRKTNEGEVTEEAPAVDSKKDGFLNYILQIRNFFGANSSPNTVSSESPASEGETVTEGETQGEEHSSAPLLPSTGPGIFLGLAGLGLGCMVVGRKGK